MFSLRDDDQCERKSVDGRGVWESLRNPRTAAQFPNTTYFKHHVFCVPEGWCEKHENVESFIRHWSESAPSFFVYALPWAGKTWRKYHRAKPFNDILVGLPTDCCFILSIVLAANPSPSPVCINNFPRSSKGRFSFSSYLPLSNESIDLNLANTNKGAHTYPCWAR